jgi:hypothetical protein
MVSTGSGGQSSSHATEDTFQDHGDDDDEEDCNTPGVIVAN